MKNDNSKLQFPKISILTPSYNQAEFLEQTILSVLNQNYPNLEFIIIDGGSSDASPQIINKYKDSLYYFEIQRDKGTYDADNKALRKMTGDYWCVLNSDDILLPNALQTVAEIAKQTAADWISGGIHAINEKGETLVEIIPQIPQTTAGYTFVTRNWIYHPSTFLSRNVYEKAGEFAESHIMDFEYWLRLENMGFKPLIINTFVSGLRFHSKCKSIDFVFMYRLNYQLLNSKYLEWRKNLSANQQNDFKERIIFFTLQYFQIKAKSELFEKQHFKAFSTVLKMLLFNPKIVLSRWFWGLLKRFFSGIEEREFNPHLF